MKNSVIQHLPPTPSTSSTLSTKVILVRHARTTYNEQQRYQGSSDESVLTAKGIRNAFSTGLALLEYDFDAIYTSPLKRVWQTTNEILAALKAYNNSPPVYSDRLLTEISMSYWQGLYYQQVKEKFPQAYNCWQNTPHLFSFNNIYPVLELFEKARLFWQKVLTQHYGQTILIVAHGGTNRALISTAVGLQPENYHSLQQSNCGISCLEFTSKNNGKLKYLNATYHLGETLPKLKAGKTGWRWLLLSDNVKNLSDRLLLNKLSNGNIDLLLTEYSTTRLGRTGARIQFAPMKSVMLGKPQHPSRSISESCAQKLATNFKIPHLTLAANQFFNWQQTIINRQKPPNSTEQSHLSTALIIASDKLIARILMKTFQIDTSHFQDILTVVHYPQSTNQQILQGILPLTSNAIAITK